MQKCAKCKEPANGALIVEGGVLYPFCDVCTKVLESFPEKNRTMLMHEYLSTDQRETQWKKNQFVHRVRRAKESLKKS